MIKLGRWSQGFCVTTFTYFLQIGIAIPAKACRCRIRPSSRFHHRMCPLNDKTIKTSKTYYQRIAWSTKRNHQIAAIHIFMNDLYSRLRCGNASPFVHLPLLKSFSSCSSKTWVPSILPTASLNSFILMLPGSGRRRLKLIRADRANERMEGDRGICCVSGNVLEKIADDTAIEWLMYQYSTVH